MDTNGVLDLKRIFLGDLPLTFALEIILRTSVMYLYALFIIRLMGKRGQTQLSPFDFVIIIALGSAVGDPMFYPDVPLFHGMLVLTTVVFLERGLAHLVRQSEKIESFVEGTPRQIIINGRLDIPGMHSEVINQEAIFTSLREAGVRQLGEVERAYLEQSGKISLFLYRPDQKQPGLPLIPPWELQMPDHYAEETPAPHEGYFSCAVCGHTVRLEVGEPFHPCLYCSGQSWIAASIDPILDEKEQPI